MAFASNGMKDFKLVDYRSHAIGKGSATKSAAYICLESQTDGRKVWGVGVDSNIESAGLKSLVCAYDRMAQITPAALQTKTPKPLGLRRFFAAIAAGISRRGEGAWLARREFGEIQRRWGD